MTLGELGKKLEDLEGTRASAERELALFKARQCRVEELEEDRDALLQSMVDEVPETLDELAGEERSRIYQMLRLEVVPLPKGGYDVKGALCTRATPSR
jgi:hypothetical protein